jgi:hypothetical protein
VIFQATNTKLPLASRLHAPTSPLSPFHRCFKVFEIIKIQAAKGSGSGQHVDGETIENHQIRNFRIKCMLIDVERGENLPSTHLRSGRRQSVPLECGEAEGVFHLQIFGIAT